MAEDRTPPLPADAAQLDQPTARRLRRVLLAVTLVIVVLLLWLAGGALTPFIFGAVIAYLLLPAVRRLETGLGHIGVSPRFRRVLAIAVVYISALVVIVTTVRLVVPPLVGQLVMLSESFPRLADQSRGRFTDLVNLYHEAVADEVEAAIESALTEFGSTLGSAARTAAAATVGWVARTANSIVGFLVIPIWLFYVLKDQERGSRIFYNLFPPAARPDVRAVIAIVDDVLKRYIRGQLLLGLAIGVASFIFLQLYDVPYALVLGIVNGIFELVPIIGPWIGAVPAVLVTLAIAPEKTPFVILFYILLQQVENSLLVPKIQGDAVDLNPAILIIALVIGGSVGGVWGLLVAVPLAAVARDVFVYLHRRTSPIEPPTA